MEMRVQVWRCSVRECGSFTFREEHAPHQDYTFIDGKSVWFRIKCQCGEPLEWVGWSKIEVTV